MKHTNSNDIVDAAELNLDELIGEIQPNYVTPNLAKVTSTPNNKKAKVIAELVMRGLVNHMSTNIQKEIIHNGEVHCIRFINIEPLLNGSWAIISLMMLSLSYGEQSTIIEAIYPEKLQLYAKAFAVVFTPELKQPTVTIARDDEMVEKIDSANAGIAMILSYIKKGTTFIPHADEINKNKQAMEQLVAVSNERNTYYQQSKRAQDAVKHRDTLTK